MRGHTVALYILDSVSEHLEVIGPTGEIDFYPLDAAHGIMTIGRAPSNDVRLRGEIVSDFVATLDHRNRPYTLMAMAPGVRVNGKALGANDFRELGSWDSVEVDGYVLIIADESATRAAAAPMIAVAPPGNGGGAPLSTVTTVGGAAVVTPIAPPPPGPSVAVVATPAATAVAAVAGAAPTPPLPPLATATPLPTLGPQIPTQTDELIYTQMAERVRTVDVLQPAMWDIKVTNGSSLVSRFRVRVEGWVDESWVTISDNDFNLVERESTTVTVTITPPRHPSSLAGAHHFGIVVTSETLPGRRAVQAATLIINPYYEYGVDPLTPSEQAIPWRRRNAGYTLPVLNRGNSTVAYRIEATDTQGATRIEFPDGQKLHLGLREVQIGPAQELDLSMIVTPHKRRLIAAGARTYNLSVTTIPLEGPAAPFPTRGELRHYPLFGRWVLFAAALLLAVVLILIFRPRFTSVRYAYVDQSGQPVSSLSQADLFRETQGGMIANIRRRITGEGEAAGALAQPDAIVRSGQPLTITWSTANGGLVSLYPQSAPESGIVNVDNPAAVRNGSAAFVPPANKDDRDRTLGPRTYEISVRNWLATFLPPLGIVRRPVIIEVIPANAPVIQSFTVNTDTTVVGNPVALAWDVIMPNPSDELMLQQLQGGEIVEEVLLPEPVGTLVLTPRDNTEYRLVPDTNEWIGQLSPVVRGQAVAVITPTPTRVPTPDIRSFFVQPVQAVAGNAITVSYSISGATSSLLRLQGVPTPLVPLDFEEGQVVIPVPGSGPIAIALESVRLPEGSDDPDDPAAGRASARTTVVAVQPTPTISPTPTHTPTATPQVPVIEVLSLSPSEIVDGETDEVLLTWNVIGDMENIVITAPEYTVTTLKKQDSISVPRDRGRVFVFTVNLDGKPAASGSVELVVLEPTPTATPEPPTPLPPPTDTPEPTATAVPPPQIVSFRASSTLPIRKEINSNGIDVYFVDGGADVVISWEATEATEVVLVETSDTGDRTYGKRLPEDQISIIASGPLDYVMTAYNNPNGVDVVTAPKREFGTATRQLRIELNPAEPPDPPTNVTFSGGTNDDDPVQISWDYNSLQVDKIIGFRVYKARAGSIDFTPIADEEDLDNEARDYKDEEPPFCDRAYFVVAVYIDLTKPGNDKTVETDSGSTSFFTPPCP